MVNLAQKNDNILEKVGELQNQGLNNSQIYDSLKKDGFNSVEIDDAINQNNLGSSQEDNFEEVPEPELKPSLLNEPEQQMNTQSRSTGSQGNFQRYNNFNPVIQEGNFQSSRQNLDEAEALIETIIEEKWKGALQRFGNLDVWKEKVRTDVGSIKQEMIRMQHRFDNIEKAVLGKISQYDRNIVNIGNEMKVLEQVFQKIINPLTTNIKELAKITKELKK